MKRNKPLKITEKQFQARVVHLAKTLGWMVYHTYDSRKSEPGFPDLVLSRDRVLFRELKTDTGKLTTAQKAWASTLQRSGADYALWRPAMIDRIAKELR